MCRAEAAHAFARRCWMASRTASVSSVRAYQVTSICSYDKRQEACDLPLSLCPCHPSLPESCSVESLSWTKRRPICASRRMSLLTLKTSCTKLRSTETGESGRKGVVGGTSAFKLDCGVRRARGVLSTREFLCTPMRYPFPTNLYPPHTFRTTWFEHSAKSWHLSKI